MKNAGNGKSEKSACRLAASRRFLAGALSGAALAVTAWPVAAVEQPANPARRAEIVNMVRQDCGSCHGMTMRGGLGPSLEARTLAGKDAGQLQFVILNGRRGTPMPPWKDFLTETEAAWVVDMLMQGKLEGSQHAR